MIDTDKYEGHTEGPWDRDGDTIFKYHKEREKWVPVQCNEEKDKAWEADMLLIEDAPLLLAEIKRLRKGISALMDNMTTAVHFYKIADETAQLYATSLKELIE